MNILGGGNLSEGSRGVVNQREGERGRERDREREREAEASKRITDFWI